MKFNDILNSVKGTIASASWKIEKHAPEILLVTGIVTTIGAVVTAVKVTPKAVAVIEEHNKQMEVIHKCEEDGLTMNPETNEAVPYTHEDAKKGTIITYLTTLGKLVKTYAITILLLAGSIASQFCGYKVLSRRLAEASAAYALLAAKFKDYRKRIADKLGVEEERVVYHNMQPVDTVVNTVDEDGNPIEKKETVFVADDDDYTGMFTQYNEDGIKNINWYPDSEQNLSWLTFEQNYWNDILKLRKGKPVTLNEVRARLGLSKTQKGQAVGWVYAPNDPKHVGDNYIDFGIDTLMRAYRNGEEMPDDNSILLDFNVDGNILYAF